MKIDYGQLNNDTPFFIFDEKELLGNLKKYKNFLPHKTEICYAMKANSERHVLEALSEAGASFEVASKYELALLKEIQVPGGRIIYGTSVKPENHIKEFVDYGVDRFAFDSLDELVKIKRQAPGARVYVRVLVNDKSKSVFRMSEKFGTSLKEGASLLMKAKEMGLIPYGISFNVGSQAKNPQSWARGVKDLSWMINLLSKEGIMIQVINFGGGFPYTYQEDDEFPNMQEISKHLSVECKKLPYEVSYIAEPGRGLVANSFILIASVIGKIKRPNGHWLYLDTGVYGGLLERIVWQGSTRHRIELLNEGTSKVKERFILTGPTGDALDVIDGAIMLPSDVKIGDKLVIYDTGAYTFTLMTTFNGFPKPEIVIKK